MSIKFGGKQTMADKMAVADALLGKHTGASKGNHAKPKPKVVVEADEEDDLPPIPKKKPVAVVEDDDEEEDDEDEEENEDD